MKPMHTFLVAAVTLVSLSQAAFADRGRWMDHGHDRVRASRVIQLGNVRMGDEFGRRDSDVIDVRNRREIECNLTHIKLSAMNDNVRITRVDVKYISGRTDTLELEDDSNTGYGGYYGRRNRGIRLGRFESSRWLDLNDVEDNRDSGRCIDQIRITGVDAADNRFERRFNFNMSPATVQVEGLLKQRRFGGFPGGGFPGHGGPGRDHGRDGGWNNGPGRDHGGPGRDHGRDHDRGPREQAFQIGTLKFTLFSSDNESFNNTNVREPVKAMIIEGSAYLNNISVVCEDGSVCYSERNKENVDGYKRINFSRPLKIKTVHAKGQAGTLTVSVIK